MNNLDYPIQWNFVFQQFLLVCWRLNYSIGFLIKQNAQVKSNNIQKLYWFDLFSHQSLNSFNLLFKCPTKLGIQNLASCVSLCCFMGDISLPLRYSYLSILPHDNADNFVATLLMSNFHFSSLISYHIISNTISYLISYHQLLRSFSVLIPAGSFKNVMDYLMEK